jgi:Protein of unknown function DUF262
MNTQKTSFKIADFVTWQKSDSLDLSPRFQRRSVWKTGAKSYLIDTILRDFAVPIIFLRDKGIDTKTFEPRREVVDGQQRLRTVLSFVCPELLKDFKKERDDFSVTKAHNAEIAGKNFHDLDEASKQAILNYEFSVQVLPASMDDREIVQLFRRLNSTNYTLNKQELRNASHFGHFKSSALTLSTEQLHRWRYWGTFSEGDISRMHEVELTSECMLAFIDSEISAKSPVKLEKLYKLYDEKFSAREEIERRFRIVMDNIENNFASSNVNSPLLKKRLIYTSISVVYDAIFGLETPVSAKAKTRKIEAGSWNKLSEVSDQLLKRTAPKSVLDSSDRRTTNIKERQTLHDFLKKCF